MTILIRVLSAGVLITAIGTGDARGESAQTDWSGGPGTTGPVTGFGDRYDTGDLGTRPVPGQVALRTTFRADFPLSVLGVDSDRPERVAAADIDGDGRNELYVTDPLFAPFDPDDRRGGIFRWSLEDGIWARSVLTDEFYGAWHIDALDFDLDGDLDLIASAYYGEIDPPPPPPEHRNGRYAWFENLDGVGDAWRKHEVGELYWGASWVDAVDVDGDGDLDLAGSAEGVGGPYEADGFVTWFENLDGQGEDFLLHDVSIDFDSAFEVHGGDLDGDGDQDLVAAGYDRFEWFENLDGTGTSWNRQIISPVFQGAGYFDLGDLDGDGDVDIIGSGLRTGVLAVWLNDGTGTSWTSIICGTWPTGKNVEIADLDGDGDLDAVMTSNNDFQWTLLGFAENLLDGVSWQIHYVENLAPAYGWAEAGDVDQDGKLELVSSFEDVYEQGFQLAAYTLSDFVDAGTLRSSILDGGAEPDWGTITWDADVPVATTLDVEVRASDDVGDLGPYVAVPASGTELGSLIDPTARYVQYRVAMSSSDDGASPILHEIDLDGGVVVAVGDAGVVAPARLRVGAVTPTPTRAGASVELSLADPGRVRGTVYDATGRRVAIVADVLLGTGRHGLRWAGRDDRGHAVAPGTYFLRIEGGHETVNRRIVRTR